MAASTERATATPALVLVTQSLIDRLGGLSLEDLARGANAAADEADQIGNSQVRKAAEVGAHLIAAKAKMKHGQWLGWLKDHFPRRERQAQSYMKLAVLMVRRGGKLPSEVASMDAAIALLGDKKSANQAAGRSNTQSTAHLKGNSEPAVVDAEFVVHDERPEPASRVTLDSLDASPTAAVATAPNTPRSMASTLISGSLASVKAGLKPAPAPAPEPPAPTPPKGGEEPLRSAGPKCDAITALVVDAIGHHGAMPMEPVSPTVDGGAAVPCERDQAYVDLGEALARCKALASRLKELDGVEVKRVQREREEARTQRETARRGPKRWRATV